LHLTEQNGKRLENGAKEKASCLEYLMKIQYIN